MGATTWIRKQLWRAGYDVCRFGPKVHPVARKQSLFTRFGIDTAIDVGANVGQFGELMRGKVGFTGKIISFEPLADAFSELSKRAANDGGWIAHNYALGAKDETAEINIAGNSQSSSLLPMLDRHSKASAKTRYVGRSTIEVRRLDSVFPSLQVGKRILLKIDTQGFEAAVLEGAIYSLRLIDTVQVEMSLVPLYEGGPLMPDLCRILNQHGYTLVALEPGFSDPSGQMLQADGIFHRFRPA